MWRSVILNFVHFQSFGGPVSRSGGELPLAGIRFSSQFMRRRATKVLSAKEFADEEIRASTDEPDIIDLSHEFPSNDSPKREFRKSNATKRLPKTKKVFRQSVVKRERDPDLNENLDDDDKNGTVFDADGHIRFIKVGTNNTKVCLLMTQLKMRNYREKHRIMLLEGKRLIREALLAGMEMKYLIFSRIEDLDFFKDLLPQTGCTIFKMFYRDIQIWSDLVTSPGLIDFNKTLVIESTYFMGRFFGSHSCSGTANFIISFNLAVFKIPNLAEKPVDKAAIPVSVICDSIREPGNLGSILRICTGGSCKRIILVKGCADLWNIKVSRGASGVHFHSKIATNYEWNRVEKRIPQNAKILVADTVGESDPNADRLPLINYDEIDLDPAKDEVFLIVGGETEGISSEAYELAVKRNGSRVHIPLANCVNSLNSSTAFGIILFELRKSFRRFMDPSTV